MRSTVDEKRVSTVGSGEPSPPVRLVCVSTVPIYYHSPLYREVAKDPRVSFRVIYTSDGGVRPIDNGFGQGISWDVDLLTGYDSEFISSAGRNPIAGSFSSVRPGDLLIRLKQARPEVLWVHGYNYLSLQLAASVQRVRRRPLLIREEQTLLERRSLSKTLLKELGLRWLFRNVIGLYIGTENRRWFEHYGVAPDHLFPTGYNVDNDRLQRSSQSLRPQRERLRRQFGIPPNAGPVVLTVSRLIPKKQPLFLLEAFRRARARAPCALLVVGSGPMEALLREAVERDGIPDVFFAGFLNQTRVPEAYACADIFALVSKEHEPWGLVVNEAMNFGLPIVVSDKVGCSTDLVSRGRNGSVSPATDMGAVTDALVELICRPDLRERYGSASLQIVARWSAERAAQGVTAAVASAVGPERWNLASR